MKRLFLFFLSLCTASAYAQQFDVNNVEATLKQIWHHDSLFWKAYNGCDVAKMSELFTDDVEFYHDKGGLMTTKAKVMEATKNALCGNPDFRLRREMVAGSVKVFHLKDVGGIISGEHVFYINNKGKPEYLDGYGKFLQVWRFENGQWKMSRVLSYDHGPAEKKLKESAQR